MSGPGKPGPARVHQDQRERFRAIIRARNRAFTILANRHWGEFTDIRNELLAEMGEPPLDETRMGARHSDA